MVFLLFLFIKMRKNQKQCMEASLNWVIPYIPGSENAHRQFNFNGLQKHLGYLIYVIGM